MDKSSYPTLIAKIDSTLGDILQEYNDAVKTLSNDRKFIRTRLLLAFSLSEVMSIIYDKYWNRNLQKSSDLLKEWWTEYCLIEENEVYKKSLYFKLMSEDRLNLFRNSIVHAFSLPQDDKSGINIVVINGSEGTPKAKLWASRFKRSGTTVLIISPDSLNNLFVAGAEMMLKKIFPPSKNPTDEEYLGAKRVHQEFERRGAHKIDIT